MSNNTTLIGHFQFDNLIKNRVNFLIVNIDVNVAELYEGIEKSHIEKSSLHANQGEALQKILQNPMPKHNGITVICKDGKISQHIANELEKNNYTNVFVVKNGLNGLKNKEELYG